MTSHATEPVPPASLPFHALRCAFGGVLMGLANLVPGISGGTMLLASGVYPRFIASIADLSRFRFNPTAIVTLASVIIAAGLAIALLAGGVKDLVVHHRWIMYSIFIGLTLGGVPIVLKLARPLTKGVWVGAVVGFVGMAALAIAQAKGSGAGAQGSQSFVVLLVAGILGASAMILPGVSGGYLLLVMGQYVPILASIDRAKDALIAREFGAAVAEWIVIVPVGIGVVMGIVAVSNVLKVMLERFEKPTLGVLLGLLVGAVVGLWPFQVPIQPEIGAIIKGAAVTQESISTIPVEDWPSEIFRPTPLHGLSAIGLIAAGFAATLLVARLGGTKPDRQTEA